jgi:hypothetical protein
MMFVNIDSQVNENNIVHCRSCGVTHGERVRGRAAAKVLDVAGFSVEMPQVCFKTRFSDQKSLKPTAT